LNCINLHASSAMAKPIAKTTLLRQAAGRGDWQRALSIAARFPQLGAHKEAITGGHCAIQNPAFYEELGQDPGDSSSNRLEALRIRYQLP
jgi:hypothetical protein